jgi:ABC-type transport system substrate-binding protein
MFSTPPFDNVDVRTALKYAINREDILQKVFLGHGTPGNDNPIAPSVKYAYDPQPKFTYDPEKAKFHLKKAGLETLKVDISAADVAFAGAIDACTLYQEHAKAAGIEINVIREPDDSFWNDVWLKKPWVHPLEWPPDLRLDVLPLMPRMPRGTFGRTRVSTSCWLRPALKPMSRNAPPCMPKCSSCCMTMAA